MTWKPLPPDSGDVPAVPLRKSLDRLAAKLGVPSADVFGRVVVHWPEVVGKDIVDHAEPRSLVDGILAISVDDARWATQLKWLGPQLVNRLNDVTGGDAVRRIEVRLRPSTPPK